MPQQNNEKFTAMSTITQITAITKSGMNLIWHETMNDFIAYELEVPNTDLSELPIAKAKAAQYPLIVQVGAVIVDAETNQLIQVIY